MKINKQDEYGLRILLRLAKGNAEEGLSIPQLSELEGLSQPYIGKITRALRLAGLIESTRGQKGGYILAKKPDQITVLEVIASLGGRFFQENFCGSHSGNMRLCTNSVDCSLRSLWTVLQYSVDQLLENITLADLIGKEEDAQSALEEMMVKLFGEQMVGSPLS